MKFITSHLIALLVLPIAHTSPHYPTPLLSVLEHLLVDTSGAHATNLTTAITPCSHYVSGPQTLGRTTAAQWLRVAFHDFVTADVEAGTGGFDASIGFETNRAEDVGSAFNDTFMFLANWVDAQVSMADMLAVAVTSSLAHCSGPILPLRGGRIDAQEAGNFGVPEPDTSLSETLAEFASSGFNTADAIGLTACGHTLGNVHHAGFPAVVDNSTVTPNNTGGAHHFDETPIVFDDNVVREYLNGTGEQGGSLVTSFNVSQRSDLRLYESDGNETMKGLVGGERFADVCKGLFTRMINTVPKEVVLTDVVVPLEVKPVNLTFDIDGAGHLTFRGVIRFLSLDDDSSVSASGTVTLGSGKNSYTANIVADSETGGGVFGNTTYYPFNIALPKNKTFPDSFSVILGSTKTEFALVTDVFFVPSLSSISSSDAGTVNLNISAATPFSRNSQNLTATVNIPTPQQLSLSPKVETSKIVLNWSGGVGPYAVYSGVVQVQEDLLRMTTVDITTVVDGVDITDEYNSVFGLLGS